MTEASAICARFQNKSREVLLEIRLLFFRFEEFLLAPRRLQRKEGEQSFRRSMNLEEGVPSIKALLWSFQHERARLCDCARKCAAASQSRREIRRVRRLLERML